MVVYFLLAALAVAAVLSAEMKSLYHSVLCLGLCGILLGAVFFSMQANLVAVFQMAIYGGVTVVLTFLVMMVGEKDE